jgi:hypothetical protein
MGALLYRNSFVRLLLSLYSAHFRTVPNFAGPELHLLAPWQSIKIASVVGQVAPVKMTMARYSTPLRMNILSLID